MNERERAICRRVRLVRVFQRLSQNDFSKLIGMTRDRLAAIEAEYSPLQFQVGQQICERCNICQRWLAEGMDPVIGRLVYPADFLVLIKPRQLFSRAYDDTLKDKTTALIEESLMATKGIQRYESAGGTAKKAAEHYAGLLRSIWFERYDIATQGKLFGWLNGAAGSFSNQNASAIVFPSGQGQEKTPLDNVHAPVNSGEVKAQWPILKKRLQKAAEPFGKKSKLAEFLGVKLASVSQWLSDSESQREPGAETTLRLLNWVEQQERQK